MKYLKLHYLLWYIVVLIVLIVDIALYLVECSIYFIWNMKNPFTNYPWSEIHNDKYSWDIENDGYIDMNPWQTFIRRCKLLK